MSKASGAILFTIESVKPPRQSNREAERGDEEIGAAFRDHQHAYLWVALCRYRDGQVEGEAQRYRNGGGERGGVRRKEHTELSRGNRAERNERDVAQKRQEGRLVACKRARDEAQRDAYGGESDDRGRGDGVDAEKKCGAPPNQDIKQGHRHRGGGLAESLDGRGLAGRKAIYPRDQMESVADKQHGDSRAPYRLAVDQQRYR